MTASDSPSRLPLSSAAIECVEIYVPKRLEYLATLYAFLQAKLKEREHHVQQEAAIDGFSLYEVDGAFYGHEIYQERTLVIRILFRRSSADDDQALARKIQLLGREIAASVAINEEELWICHYPQGVVIFRARRSED